jgi:hypothetical protein
MTKKEALLFFPHEKDDDLEDLWEERLFEQKQFFLTRPPLAKVFRSRLKKLEKQHAAYLTLIEDSIPVITLDNVNLNFNFSTEIIAAFNDYHSLRNDFKHKLLKASDFVSLKKIVESWLIMEQAYHTMWSYPASINADIEVAKSKEPDPMIVLENLKRLFSEKNIKTFNDLQSHYNDLGEVIRKEVKRLTLLSNN